jgi:hypothetical protein
VVGVLSKLLPILLTLDISLPSTPITNQEEEEVGKGTYMGRSCYTERRGRISILYVTQV